MSRLLIKENIAIYGLVFMVSNDGANIKTDEGKTLCSLGLIRNIVPFKNKLLHLTISDLLDVCIAPHDH